MVPSLFPEIPCITAMVSEATDPGTTLHMLLLPPRDLHYHKEVLLCCCVPGCVTAPARFAFHLL